MKTLIWSQKRCQTLKNKIMELVIGMIIIVALIVGFMVANDISERQSYDGLQRKIGKKLMDKEKEKDKGE